MAITLVFDRRVLGLVFVAAAVALGVTLAAPVGAFHGPVLREMSSRQLDDLALVADLRADDGSLRDTMTVGVVREGGSAWAGEAVAAAVEADPHFEEGNSRHLLRVEAVQTPNALGLQLHLWRQGWELRVPDPASARVQPWIAVFAAALGALLAAVARKMAAGLLFGGLLAQLVLAMSKMPPEVLAPGTWRAEVQGGPLFHAVRTALAPVQAYALPVAAAVVAFSIVLVFFDHRRSVESAASMGLGTSFGVAVVGTFGALTWLEAAARCGLVASASSSWGFITVVALVAAWIPVAWSCGARRAG